MPAHGSPLPIDSAVLKNGGSITTESGTAIVSVSSNGQTVTLTGTETVVASEIALAEGNVLVGNSSGVAAAVSAKTSGRILVGNGTTVAPVAVSGDATLSSAGTLTVANVTVGSDAAGDIQYKSGASAMTRLAKGTAGQMMLMNAGATAPSWVSMSGDVTMANGVASVANGAVTRAKASTALQRKAYPVLSATIATTGNVDHYIIAPETGTLDSVDFAGFDALSANDTNYITWGLMNLGADGTGSTQMLDTGAVNTTKVTGGSAIAAKTRRALAVNGTLANLNVNAGDLLRLRAAVSGTLANQVTFPAYCVRFTGTT